MFKRIVLFFIKNSCKTNLIQYIYLNKKSDWYFDILIVYSACVQSIAELIAFLISVSEIAVANVPLAATREFSGAF